MSSNVPLSTLPRVQPVPLFSAAAANRPVNLVAALERVVASNHYVLGREVAAFEDAFARYVGVSGCVSVANGSDALELALRALGVRRGDKVVCVANAGFYSATAIHLVGAIPLYIEIDEATMTMSPMALAGALAEKPAAVIVTHLYGQLAAVEPIASMCRGAGVPLIEDCAQSHGARRGGRSAGAFGDIACFSFYPTKNLGALGDGGAVCANDVASLERVRRLRQYGWSRKYEVVALDGRNSRLDELQAAVLLDKLPHLDGQNGQRRAIATTYARAFEALPLKLPASVGEDFVAHLYVVRTNERDALRAHLDMAGISTDIHYPIIDTRQPSMQANAREWPALPVSEACARTVLTLPCYPGMPADDIERVCTAVRAFFAGV